jgi:eukaryotic-like serine/threonine-protein kinase
MRARDYQPGEQVPGTVYKVVRLIGAGGMGTVYDVEDTSIGKRYVLKTLHPKLGAREDLARRIQHEARTLARLNHPNIVEVITAGVTTDDLRLPYYLMERLSGQSLRVILEKKGQLELSHAYHIGIDLLDALDHAHDKGVIHRDVKPDNIFLHRTAAGVTLTKLLDFGIVSMLDGDHGETAGRFLGTLRYASPEQLRGDKPSPKTDVYSAALVIYEIVAGRGPFDDQGDGRRIAAAHLGRIAPPLSRFVAGIPKELDALLAAALAKSQEVRPRDAFSFGASLRNLKRMLEGARPSDTTDSRVTSPALAPDSVPEARAGALAPEPLAGAPPSSVEPSLGSGSAFTGTTASEMDRVCATNTQRPDLFDTMRASPYGTEATSVREGDELEPAPADLPAPALEWPPARSVARSLEPQVRSLRMAAPARSGRSLARLGLGAGVLCLVAAAAVSIARCGPFDAGARDVPTATAAAALVAGPKGVDLVLPAPTLAPPAFEAPPREPAVASAVPAPSAKSSPSAPEGPAPRPSARSAPPKVPAESKANVPARAADRPGPGF